MFRFLKQAVDRTVSSPSEQAVTRQSEYSHPDLPSCLWDELEKLLSVDREAAQSGTLHRNVQEHARPQ